MEADWLQVLDEEVGVDVLDGLLEDGWWQAWCDQWEEGSGSGAGVRSLSNEDIDDRLNHRYGS